MRAFLRVEPTGTIASFEQVGIPMATELVGGIVFYPPPKKPRHVNPSNTRAAAPPLREEPPLIVIAYQHSAPTGTRTQNTRILSPLSLPIGL